MVETATHHSPPSDAAFSPREVPQARPWIATMDAYVPGRRVVGINLASNEVPRVPFPVVDAPDRWDLSSYPDSEASKLSMELARLHGVDAESVGIFNGSDEALTTVLSAFAANGSVAYSDPGYAMMRIGSERVNAEHHLVPLDDYRHDLTGLARAEVDVLYVSNPNNPTGTAHSTQEITEFVKSSRARVIVVDEAYIEFTSECSVIAQVASLPRLIVLRTFSKAYGLAGARIGYAVADRQVMAELKKARNPFAVSSPAQALGLAALGRPGALEQVIASNSWLRARLVDLLMGYGMECSSSAANFVLARVSDERAVVEGLYERGISIRPGTSLGVQGHVRVTVPSLSGIARLAEALATIPPEVLRVAG